MINILPLDMRVVSFNLNRRQKQIKSDDELYYKRIQTKQYIQKYYRVKRESWNLEILNSRESQKIFIFRRGGPILGDNIS